MRECSLTDSPTHGVDRKKHSEAPAEYAHRSLDFETGRHTRTFETALGTITEFAEPISETPNQVLAQAGYQSSILSPGQTTPEAELGRTRSYKYQSASTGLPGVANDDNGEYGGEYGGSAKNEPPTDYVARASDATQNGPDSEAHNVSADDDSLDRVEGQSGNVGPAMTVGTPADHRQWSRLDRVIDHTQDIAIPIGKVSWLVGKLVNEMAQTALESLLRELSTETLRHFRETVSTNASSEDLDAMIEDAIRSGITPESRVLPT